jgi:tetratricopeptide (TPR) repeat protein
VRDMARVRISRKRLLKEPDEFISTTGRIMDFVKTHQKWVFTAVGVLAVLVAFAVLWRGHLKRQDAEASDLYYQASQQFRKAEDGLLAESETKEGFESALKRFESVRADFKGTRYALISLLYQGHCLYQLNRYDEAIEAYQKFLSKGSREKPLLPFVIQSIAYAYRAKGEYGESNRYFNSILDTEEGQGLRRSILIEIGRNHEMLSENAKALQIYKEVIKENPDDLSLTLIKEKVLQLEGKGSPDS